MFPPLTRAVAGPTQDTLDRLPKGLPVMAAAPCVHPDAPALPPSAPPSVAAAPSRDDATNRHGIVRRGAPELDVGAAGSVAQMTTPESGAPSAESGAASPVTVFSMAESGAASAVTVFSMAESGAASPPPASIFSGDELLHPPPGLRSAPTKIRSTIRRNATRCMRR